MPVYRNSEAFHALALDFFQFMSGILDQIEQRAKLNSIALSHPQLDHNGRQEQPTFHQRLLIQKGNPKVIITLRVEPPNEHRLIQGYAVAMGAAGEAGYGGMAVAKDSFEHRLDEAFPKEERRPERVHLPIHHWLIGIQEPPVIDGDNPPGADDFPQKVWEGSPWDGEKVYEAFDYLVELLKPQAGQGEPEVDVPPGL